MPSEPPARLEEDATAVLAGVGRRLWLVVGCGFLAAALALAWSLLQDDEYTAAASLLFRESGFEQTAGRDLLFQVGGPDPEAASNAELGSGDEVAARTAEQLDAGLDAGAVSGMVSLKTDGADDAVVNVEATADDPEAAADLSNAYAHNLIRGRVELDRRRVQSARDSVESDYRALPTSLKRGTPGRALRRQLDLLATMEALQTGTAELVEEAEPPGSASAPKPTRNSLIGGLLGLLLGAGLALLLDRLDRRVRTASELGEVLELPVLAEIPDRSAADGEPGLHGLSPAALEAFRSLRARVRGLVAERGAYALLVAPTAPGDGGSSTAWRLGQVTAVAGVRVVLVEADLHRPGLADRLGLKPDPGLSDLLAGGIGLREVVQRLPVEGGPDGELGIDVITAGTTPDDPARMIGSRRMARLLEVLRKRYALTVVDAPPLAMVGEATALTRLVDGIVVVAQVRKTTRAAAARLHDQLVQLDAPAVGVVANRSGDPRGY